MTSKPIYTSEKVLPYVYMCTHKITGEFYIGSRTTKKLNMPSHLDFPKYRTSSKIVNPIFEEFDWHIIAEFFLPEDAYSFEQQLISENWESPLILNGSFQLTQKFNPGQAIKSRNKAKTRMLSDKNPAYNQSQETRDKISNTSKNNMLEMSEEERSLKYGNFGENNPMYNNSHLNYMTDQEIQKWKSKLSNFFKQTIWMHNFLGKNIRVHEEHINEAIEQGCSFGYANGTHPNENRSVVNYILQTPFGIIECGNLKKFIRENNLKYSEYKILSKTRNKKNH